VKLSDYAKTSILGQVIKVKQHLYYFINIDNALTVAHVLNSNQRGGGLAMPDINKTRLLLALANVTGFDFNLTLYKQVGSFEKAVHLFVKHVIERLLAVNNIFTQRVLHISAEVIHLRSKDQINKEISTFVDKVYNEILLISIQEYIEISKMYKEPKSTNKHSLLVSTMLEYRTRLNSEFSKINSAANELTLLGGLL
jgi:hypothetical protein